MDIEKLKTELAGVHPDTGAYDADDQLAADELNAVNRVLNKSSLTASEVFNAFVKADYEGLAAADQDRIWNILSMGILNPFGLEADVIADIFGNPSTTLTSLKAIRITNVSRAVEIGI